MKQEDTQKLPWDAWLYKWFTGALLGSVNAFSITPFANYNNHVIERRSASKREPVKFTCARMFDGAMSYQTSFILRVSTALVLNSALLHAVSRYQTVTERHRLLSSVISGGLAGIPAIIPEGIAQTKQLSTPKPTTSLILQQAFRAHGLFGMHNGTVALMGRNTAFTTGYIYMMPKCIEYAQQYIQNPQVASLFSALFCGLCVGTITTPCNFVRAIMQQQFTTPTKLPTYKEIFKNTSMRKMCTTGFWPRTGLNVVSMFVVTEGNKLFDLFSKEGYPDFPSLQNVHEEISKP